MDKIVTPYHTAEIIRHNKELAAISNDSLDDRKESERTFISEVVLSRPSFYEAVSFLLNGSYGSGAYFAFCTLSKRSNRRAWLFTTVATLEYRVPMRAACKVWKFLHPDIQADINEKLDAMIAEHDENPLCAW